MVTKIRVNFYTELCTGIILQKCYLIQVNDVNFPQDLIEKKWADEFSQIEYKNVFALKSVCDFPENIKEDDSFNFIIDNKKKSLCCLYSFQSNSIKIY